MLHYPVGHRLTGPDVALISVLQQLQLTASRVVIDNHAFAPHRVADEITHGPELLLMLKRAIQAVNDVNLSNAEGRPRP